MAKLLCSKGASFQPVEQWKTQEAKMTIQLEVLTGGEIKASIREAIALADEGRCLVEFEFNGVKVRVAGNSDSSLIYRDWDRTMSGYIKGVVGPRPKPSLSRKELASDARIAAAKEAKRVERAAAQNKLDEEKRLAIEDKLAMAPAMEIGNEENWIVCRQKNPDGYGKAILDYAERWARLMQLEMVKGKSVEAVAGETSFTADLEGVTGFMHGAAVATLVGCWKYGEDLRRWHNAKYGVSADKPGVVNPAVLVIGG